MTILQTLKNWNQKRCARNEMHSHADRIGRQHDQKTRRWIRLRRYYLYAVKGMRLKAEDIAERRRDKGYNTAIVELNAKRSAYGVYVNL